MPYTSTTRLAVWAVLCQCFVVGNWYSNWVPLSTLPDVAVDCNAIRNDGKLYVTGGFIDRPDAVQHTYILDPQTMNWETSTSEIPYAVSGSHTTTPFDGDRYLYAFTDASLLAPAEVFSTYETSDHPPRVMRFDTEDQKWSVIDSSPRNRTSGSAIAYMGQIYIFGGYLIDPITNITEETETNTVITFDPITGDWSEGLSMPKAMARPTVGVADLLYLIGGIRDREWTTDFWSLSRGGSTEMIWTVKGSTPTSGVGSGMGYPSMQIVGGVVWIVGDIFPGVGASQTMLAFMYDLYVEEWDSMHIAGLANGRARYRACTATSTGTSTRNFFLFGGVNYSDATQGLPYVDLMSASIFPMISREGLTNSYVVGANITFTPTEVSPPNPFTFRISSTPECMDRAAGTVDQLWDGSQNQINFLPEYEEANGYLCFSSGKCAATGRENCANQAGTGRDACMEAGCCYDATQREAQCFKKQPELPGETLYYMTPLLWAKSFDIVNSTPPTPEPPAPTLEPTPIPTDEPTPVPFETDAPESQGGYTNLSLQDILLLFAAAIILISVCVAAFYLLRRTKEGPPALKRRVIGGKMMFPPQYNSSNYNSVECATHPGDADTDVTPANGKYVILSKIGSGGYGHVFLVRRISDSALLAMKYIAVANDEDRRDAIAEFEAMRALKGHPHVINVIDMFMSWSEEEDDTSEGTATQNAANNSLQGSAAALLNIDRRYVCIVMEYFPGGDLKHYFLGFGLPELSIEQVLSTQAKGGSVAELYRNLRIQGGKKKDDQKIPEATIWYITHQVCAALAYMHTRSPPVVHRDLKPENLLISEKHLTQNGAPTPKIIVTDLGLAKGLSDATYCQTQAGSLPYVAPECWQRHYSVKVDIWALGCIVYSTCTNRVDSTRTRVMFSEVNKPTFKEDLTREVTSFGYTQEMVDFILLLLKPDPHDRY